MTYKQANAMKDLAKPVYDVLRRLYVECPDSWQFCTCKTYNKLGKVKWIWTSQPGNWYLLDEEVFLVDQFAAQAKPTNPIPIIEWEEIEKILKKAGYILSQNSYTDKKGIVTYGAWFNREKHWKHAGYGEGRTRQESVMKTIIALGRKLK